MLMTDCDKNIRRYPNQPKKKEEGGKVIVLPPPKDDGWESINEIKTQSTIIAPNGQIISKAEYADDIDENDFGGLIHYEKRLSGIQVITKEQIEQLRGEGQPDYSQYVIKAEQEKIKWIDPKVIAIGAHPILYALEDDLTYLRDQKIRAVVSAYEVPLEHKYIQGLNYYFAPTIKEYTADLIGICEFIEKMEEEKKAVFIHSGDGLGRAPTIVAAYFTYRRWLSVNEAITYVMREIPGSMKSNYQRAELVKFSKRLS